MATVPEIRATPYAPMHFGFGPKILDRYIFRELAAPFVITLAIVWVFWFVNIYFLAADFIINAHAPIFLVLRFLFFRIPQSTPFAFPLSCLFGVLLALSRLAADNEIAALRTSGVRFLRIAVTPLLFGLAMFGISYYVNESLVPKSVELSTRTYYQIITGSAELPIVPQFFRKDDTTGRVFYVGDVLPDHKTMKNVMIFEPAVTTPFRQVANAQRGTIEGDTIKLFDARVTRFKKTGEVDGFTISPEMTFGLPVGQTPDQFLNLTTSDVYTENSGQLRDQVRAMEVTGQGGSALDQLKMTLAQKLAFPFGCFIAVFISLPLAVQFGKKGRLVGFASAILLFFIYYLIMSAFAALGKNGAVNPYFAAWAPNALIGLVGVALFYRVEH